MLETIQMQSQNGLVTTSPEAQKLVQEPGISLSRSHCIIALLQKNIYIEPCSIMIYF